MGMTSDVNSEGTETSISLISSSMRFTFSVKSRSTMIWELSIGRIGFGAFANGCSAGSSSEGFA